MDDRPPPGWVEFDEIKTREGDGGGSTLTETAPIPLSPLQKLQPVVVTGHGQKVADSSSPAVISPRQETMLDAAALGRQTPAAGAATAVHNGKQADEKNLNGKVLVSVMPENTSCAWVVPPRYNPYSMPAILASQGIKMLPDDYVTALEMLTNDFRFRSYSSLYGRLLALWMTFSLVVLLVVLFSSPKGGLPVLIFCFGWCFTVLAGILGCCVIRKQIRIGLRHAVQQANKMLIKHNVLAGVEDRGQISCHKVVIHLMYFKVDECLPDIERLLRIKSTGGAVLSAEAPSSQAEVAEQARHLILKYSQGYVKDSCRNRILFPSRPSQGVSDYAPKHCLKKLCLCQFVEKHHFNRRAKKWYEHFV